MQRVPAMMIKGSRNTSKTGRQLENPGDKAFDDAGAKSGADTATYERHSRCRFPLLISTVSVREAKDEMSFQAGRSTTPDPVLAASSYSTAHSRPVRKSLQNVFGNSSFCFGNRISLGSPA